MEKLSKSRFINSEASIHIPVRYIRWVKLIKNFLLSWLTQNQIDFYQTRPRYNFSTNTSLEKETLRKKKKKGTFPDIESNAAQFSSEEILHRKAQRRSRKKGDTTLSIHGSFSGTNSDVETVSGVNHTTN